MKQLFALLLFCLLPLAGRTQEFSRAVTVDANARPTAPLDLSGGNIALPATVYVTGADATGATDATAAFQAAHDALPARGGRIVVPPGRFRIGGTVNLSKPCIVQGSSGVGTVTAPGASNPGTNALVSMASADLFLVTAPTAVFEDLAFESGVTAPTAGAFIHCGNPAGPSPVGNFYRVTGCNFAYGWTHVQIDNGNAWAIAQCTSFEAARYGFDVADVASPDNGDNVITACIIGTSHSVGAGSAAIHYRNGGGLKIVGTKINGGTAAGQSPFAYGIYMDFLANTASSIFLLTGCSIENVSAAGVYQNLGVPGQANFSKIVISANEFFNTATGISLGNYSGGTPIQGSVAFEIGGNVFTNLDTAVYIGAWTDGHIATQTCNAVNHPVVLSGYAYGIHVDPQYRPYNTLGYTIEAAPPQGGVGDARNFANFSTKAMLQNYSTTRSNAIRFGLVPFSGVVLRVSLQGQIPYRGYFHVVMTRNVYNENGATTITTVGTDTMEGSGIGSQNLNLTWTGSAAEADLTQISVDAGYVYNADIEVLGPLQFLKIGN